MPPKRQSSGTARSAKQSTLAFHGSSNKVTKSGTRTLPGKKDAANQPASNVVEPEAAKGTTADDVELTDPESTTADTPEPAVIAEKPASTPEEEQARKVTATQIKEYWVEKEKRKAPRVHQKDLNMHEKVLREFDMSSHYGPCVGINRLRRWQRANRLGLKPPIEVLAVLLKEQDNGDKSLVQRSRVDELLNSHNLELDGGA